MCDAANSSGFVPISPRNRHRTSQRDHRHHTGANTSGAAPLGAAHAGGVTGRHLLPHPAVKAGHTRPDARAARATITVPITCPTAKAVTSPGQSRIEAIRIYEPLCSGICSEPSTRPRRRQFFDTVGSWWHTFLIKRSPCVLFACWKSKRRRVNSTNKD